MASILDRMKHDKMEIANLQDSGSVPHYYAVTPDQLTSVELTGDPAHFTRIALVGVMSNRHLGATARNGAWAALLLALAMPDWKGGQEWLTGRIRKLRSESNVHLSRDGWKIHLAFDTKTGMMILQFVRA
jgi:hypothetical protein